MYIYDSDGNKLLDGMSGLWCCNLGYSQTTITDAVYAQLQELPYYNNFFQCSNQPSVELARALVEITPAQFNHVFFTNSGSEANDTNLRLVHRYYDLLDKPEKKHIISRRNAYHGSTIAAASLGGMSSMHQQMHGLDYVHHINQPHWFAEGGNEDPGAYGLRVARELEEKIDELGEDRVADVLLAHNGEFAHGLTYSGHPASCAAGIATLRVLSKQSIIQEAANVTAPYFQSRLRELRDHPIVGEVRGMGMFAALELVSDKGSRERLAPDAAAAQYCRNQAKLCENRAAAH